MRNEICHPPIGSLYGKIESNWSQELGQLFSPFTVDTEVVLEPRRGKPVTLTQNGPNLVCPYYNSGYCKVSGGLGIECNSDNLKVEGNVIGLNDVVTSTSFRDDWID